MRRPKPSKVTGLCLTIPDGVTFADHRTGELLVRLRTERRVPPPGRLTPIPA